MGNVDIETIVVAALPGILFGGINIYTLLKFSFGLGKYQGEQDAKSASLGSDLRDIKADIFEIRTDVKSAANSAQAHTLQMQAHDMLIKYLQERDKELGARTHKIANMEIAIQGLAADLGAIKRQLESR